MQKGTSTYSPVAFRNHPHHYCHPPLHPLTNTTATNQHYFHPPLHPPANTTAYPPPLPVTTITSDRHVCHQTRTRTSATTNHHSSHHHCTLPPLKPTSLTPATTGTATTGHTLQPAQLRSHCPATAQRHYPFVIACDLCGY